MKTTLTFAVSFLLAMSLLAQQPTVQRDTVPALRLPGDTLVQRKGWEIRRPLTQEQVQRRADNRAEVEDMKARFRQFHQEEEKQKTAADVAAEDENYLWSEGQAGGRVQPKGTGAEANGRGTNTEELRMEIGRNLQEGRRMVPDQQPASPAYPNEPMPASYDYPSSPPAAQEDWQETIRYSLQAKTPQGNDQWQARSTGVGAVGLVNPETGQVLQAGQTLQLTRVSFVEGGADLTPAAQDALYQWASILQQNPGLIVQVRAHTHSDIATFEAQQLTNQRAEAITRFWQQAGVPAQQIGYRGYGRLSPLVSSADPLAKQKNERIELVILEMP
mgnify:CR=1 FL=1